MNLEASEVITKGAGWLVGWLKSYFVLNWVEVSHETVPLEVSPGPIR